MLSFCLSFWSWEYLEHLEPLEEEEKNENERNIPELLSHYDVLCKVIVTRLKANRPRKNMETLEDQSLLTNRTFNSWINQSKEKQWNLLNITKSLLRRLLKADKSLR